MCIRDRQQPSKQQKKQPEEEDKEEGEENVCEFCEKHDPEFGNGDYYDLHLWRECPILTVCQHCQQVVKISELNEHLLEECDKKKLNKRCPRCKESVSVMEFDDHVEEMGCIPSKAQTVASRCPLCHQDIPPGEEGWKKHLVKEGCPNNERD
eukprot:TRINITY_DN3795_c0_g1_i6.p1 TRINITY_DN3795_c0_g1~~TRINITY_DN3795_c0_g1_i6.p1  ORF type:complete len:152 (+),score=37.37 TRINITY_DN3795_c0_g1_i6:86-541(+)